MARKTVAIALIVPALVAALAACTSSGGDPSASPTATGLVTGSPSGSSSSTTASKSAGTIVRTPTPSASVPAAAQAAVSAYVSFTKAQQASQRRPPKSVSGAYTAGGDFTRYSFDPIRTDVISLILNFTQGRIAFRGTPPTPRVRVVSTSADAARPTVTLRDCPTAAPTWTAFYESNGKAIPARPSGAPLPHLLVVTVIYFQNRWGVSKIVPDIKHTCEAP